MKRGEIRANLVEISFSLKTPLTKLSTLTDFLTAVTPLKFHFTLKIGLLFETTIKNKP